MHTEIDGAVVASGTITVEARQQAIQHPDGGTVAALHVREGGAVAAGDPILTLDGTEIAAEMALAQRELFETRARLDRLGAELRGAERVAFRDAVRRAAESIPGADEVLAEEAALFEARRATLAQTLALLSEREVQSEARVGGLERQLSALAAQLVLIEAEREGQESLLDRGLTVSARVTDLRREAARLEGSLGEIEAGIAEARSAIAGYGIERLRQEAAFREAAQDQLRALQPVEAELAERLRVLERRIERLTLRAPMAGTVIGLTANTVGGVITAGDEIAAIVPGDAPLVLAVEIDPAQVDQVHPGQPATLRFPNFTSTTTPEVAGVVRLVSADAHSDPATGRRYYLAELDLDAEAGDALELAALRPGMPVEAFIRTDPRTPASFLLKPLADYWAYAMREE
jgi:HlyD family secretion protein